MMKTFGRLTKRLHERGQIAPLARVKVRASSRFKGFKVSLRDGLRCSLRLRFKVRASSRFKSLRCSLRLRFKSLRCERGSRFKGFKVSQSDGLRCSLRLRFKGFEVQP